MGRESTATDSDSDRWEVSPAMIPALAGRLYGFCRRYGTWFRSASRRQLRGPGGSSGRRPAGQFPLQYVDRFLTLAMDVWRRVGLAVEFCPPCAAAVRL